MDKKLEVFRNGHCFNKEELQRAADQLIEHYTTCDRHKFGFSEEYRQCLLELCKRFKNTLDEYSIPALTENWLFYEIQILNDSIDLMLLSCSDYELDENGNEQSMTLRESCILICVKSEYLTVDQFARVYGVTESTVINWIRKGKLCTAKKVGNTWFIPAIADKPSRKFERVEYTWDALPHGLEEHFPYLIGHNRIYIYQDEESSSPYKCILGYSGESGCSNIALSLQELERLEFALISTGSVTARPMRITFTPNKLK